MKKKYLLNGAQIPKLQGVTVEGDTVIFDGYTEGQIEQVRKLVEGGGKKHLEAEIQKAYKPTDDEREKVESLVGEDRAKDFFFVETVAAETLIDRAFDKFSKAFLGRMAEKYIEGRSVVDSHDTRKRIGRTFAAEVIPHPEKDGEHQLIVKFYLSPSTTNGENAINEIKDGIVDRVSVSFRPDYEAVKFYDSEDEKSPEPGKTFWYIDAGDKEYEEVIELSLVAMGAQPGAKFKGENARVTKFPTFGEEIVSNESEIVSNVSEMELKEIKYTIGGEEKIVKVNKEAADTVSDLVKTVADLEAEAAKVADLEKALKAFREKEAEAKTALVTEFVNLKKTFFGDDAIDAEEETEIANDLSVSYLEKEIKRLKSAIKAKTGSLDPSKGKKDDGENQEKTGTWVDNA